MDIDLLSKMVKELILDNDRVVLPGLGSFVAEIVPSTFSDRGYTINPPYRKLYFRSKPDEGDMLVHFYAESNGLDMEMAERIIKDFVSELKTILHTKKTVIFPGLGRLRATKENNVFFVADEDLDIYPAGFGLEPISLKTHVETPNEPIDLELDDLVPEEWGSATESEEISAVAKEVVETEPVAEVEPEIELVADEDPEIEVVHEQDSESNQETTSEGEPVAEPEIEAENGSETEDESVEESVEESDIEHQTQVESEQEEGSETEPEVESEAEQESASVVEQEQVEEVAMESVEEVAVESVESVEEVQSEPIDVVYVPSVKKDEYKALKVIGIVIASLVALLIIYMVVMRLFPNLLNDVLYTPEELEIINFK